MSICLKLSLISRGRAGKKQKYKYLKNLKKVKIHLKSASKIHYKTKSPLGLKCVLDRCNLSISEVRFELGALRDDQEITLSERSATPGVRERVIEGRAVIGFRLLHSTVHSNPAKIK